MKSFVLVNCCLVLILHLFILMWGVFSLIFCLKNSRLFDLFISKYLPFILINALPFSVVLAHIIVSFFSCLLNLAMEYSHFQFLMTYGDYFERASVLEPRPPIPPEFYRLVLHRDLHKRPTMDVPCTNDLESFIQVHKRLGNQRFERMLYNRRIDYMVAYVKKYFVMTHAYDVTDYDSRLPEVDMLIRRCLLEFKDMDWSGPYARAINNELRHLNSEMSKLLVGYFAFLNQYKMMVAEHDHSVMMLLHSQAAELAGLHPLDYDWRRWDFLIYDQFKNQTDWDSFREYMLLMEPWVDSNFVDIQWTLEFFVQRIIRNEELFNKLYSIKLGHEAMDRALAKLPAELSYEEDVRYRSLVGWDMLRHFARERLAWCLFERDRYMHVMRTFFDAYSASYDAAYTENVVFEHTELLAQRRERFLSELTRDYRSV